jgi:hypothetical protein
LGDVGADRKGTLLAHRQPGDWRGVPAAADHNSLRLVTRREGPLSRPTWPSQTFPPAGVGLPLVGSRAQRNGACPQEGCSEAVLLAHGFTVEQMVELVRAGLATATPQRVRAGRTTMEVATLRITEAGRRVLGEVRNARQQ